jgi:hypothetical protein
MIVELLEDKNLKITYLGYMAEELKRNERAYYIEIEPICGMCKIYSLNHIKDIYKSDNEIEDFLDLRNFDKYYTIDKLVIERFMMNGKEFGDFIEYKYED